MSLTAYHIETALQSVGAGSKLVMTSAEIAEAFNFAILKYGDGLFDTTDKVAALVSECMMESGYFRTTEEYFKKGSYAPYIGRTFIQITWKSNYAKFGAWCAWVGLLKDPDYFVNKPERLADVKWAALGGVWYFTRVLFAGKPLTAYAGNILQVGKAVNLGDPYSKAVPNGQAARETAFKAVQALGPAIIPVEIVKKKEIIMAAGKSVRFWNNEDRTLKVGDNYVRITKGKSDVTAVFGPNAGVDVIGVVEVDNPGNYPIRVFWRILDYKEGDSRPKESGIWVPLTGASRQVGQASFKGSLGRGSAVGRSMRLRLMVHVDALSIPEGGAVPPLPTINNVHIDGWKL